MSVGGQLIVGVNDHTECGFNVFALFQPAVTEIVQYKIVVLADIQCFDKVFLGLVPLFVAFIRDAERIIEYPLLGGVFGELFKRFLIETDGFLRFVLQAQDIAEIQQNLIVPGDSKARDFSRISAFL